MREVLGGVFGILLGALLLLPESKIKKYLFKFLLFISGLLAALLILLFVHFLISSVPAVWDTFYSALEKSIESGVRMAESTPFPPAAKILLFIICAVIVIPLVILFPICWIYPVLPAFIFLAIAIEGFFSDLLSKKATLFGASFLAGIIRGAARGMGPLPIEEHKTVSAEKIRPPGIKRSALLWMISLFICSAPYLFLSGDLRDALGAVGVTAVAGLGIPLILEIGKAIFIEKSKKDLWWLIPVVVFSAIFAAFMTIATLKESSLNIWVHIPVWILGVAFFIFSLTSMWKKS